MTHPAPIHATLDDWIAREAIPFSVDSPRTFSIAVDKVIASLGDSVELLGFGEALHGGEDIFILRNRLFQRLVEAHGYSAIAIESSFPRAHVVNEYVAGRGPASYEAVQDTGFSHGFGRLDANRELVEWMRRYNAASSHRVQLQFYGFDSPTEMMGSDSPRQVLHFVLDYLASIDSASSQEHRQRIDPLLGQDSDWENPVAMTDPTKSVGLSPAATALRIETEELISELRVRRPELVAKSDEPRYLEAAQYASVARQLLNYHAALARASSDRMIRLLGIRDALMANNLVYMVSRERGRGKVLAFAHNSHLRRGKAQWQLGTDVYTWWPAGAHLNEMLGPRYAVIGSALGVSDANGIGQPETGTLENRLTAVPGPARFIPGASGDLAPLAHLALVLVGEGEAFLDGKRYNGADALQYAKLKPLCLQAKEGLALINGTHLMEAVAVLALADARMLLLSAEAACAMSLEGLMGSHVPLDARIHQARGQRGQQESAVRLLKLVSDSEINRSHQNCVRIQDPYTLRCAPQVFGAVRDALDYCAEVFERELGAVTDNPLVFPAEDAVLSGGNFHGQPLALALDMLAIALTHLASFSERRIYSLMGPHDWDQNGAPFFLAPRSGLNSGFMIAQYVAAALVNEIKILAHPASIDSIPTSAGMEDFVSMGVTSAHKVAKILEQARQIVAIELMCAAQMLEFRRPLLPGKGVQETYARVRTYVPKLEYDRVLAPDIAELTAAVKQGVFASVD